MKRDGQTLEVHVYNGAYHDFDNTLPYFKYFPDATTAGKCPQVILDIRHDAYYYLMSGEKYPSFAAMEAEYKGCIVRGASAGANMAESDRSEADVKRFLTQTMALTP